MPSKSYIVLSLILISVAFASGRYLTPTKIETKTVIVQAEKTDIKQNINTIEKVNKDGSKIITTKTTTDTKINDVINTSTDKIVENKKNNLLVSALFGIDITHPGNGFIYGLSISKQLIGPIEFGAWGLTNSSFGVSGGIRF